MRVLNWIIDLTAPDLEEQDRVFGEIDADYTALLTRRTRYTWQDATVFLLYFPIVGYALTYGFLIS